MGETNVKQLEQNGLKTWSLRTQKDEGEKGGKDGEIGWEMNEE